MKKPQQPKELADLEAPISKNLQAKKRQQNLLFFYFHKNKTMFHIFQCKSGCFMIKIMQFIFKMV